MELVHGAPIKASRSALENDYISRMPNDVITNILERLPIQEAVRTDILSKNWRYKWTKLTRLIFDNEFFDYFLGPGGSRYENRRVFNRLLLNFELAISKLVLYVPLYPLDYEDYDIWVYLICRRRIQELTLINMGTRTQLKLPSLFFMCEELKHLKLGFCFFPLVPSFDGFPELLSLELEGVRFESTECVDFIPKCELLEVLRISDGFGCGHTGVKLDMIAELVNLRILSLSMCVLSCMMYNTAPITSSSIIQLMCHLPKLQELSLDFWACEFIAEVPEASVDKMVPYNFLGLRALTLTLVDLSSDNFVSFVIEMIRGSPNLQTLDIVAGYKNEYDEHSSLDFDCSKLGQLQLQSVKIELSRCSDNKLCLIKYILACSPLLKKITVIYPMHLVVMNSESFGLLNIC